MILHSLKFELNIFAVKFCIQLDIEFTR